MIIRQRKLKYTLTIAFNLFILGFLIPEPIIIPVENASSRDWNPNSFWYEPWGASGTHKGVDIFAKRGTPVLSTTGLLILYRGKIERGGNTIIALGPKWKIHYFTHLNSIRKDAGIFTSQGETIGTVGSTGNAQGKQPHLHYSIISLLPRVWNIDMTTQGYKKAFYINPIKYLSDADFNTEK